MYLVSVILLFLIWGVSAKILDAPLVLPCVGDVLKSLASLFLTPSFWQNVLFTFARVFVSFAFVVFSGLFLGLLCGRFKTVKKLLAFPIAFLRATPVVALILVLLFAFSSSLVPVCVAILMALPVMISAVSEAFNFTDGEKKLFEMAKIFGFTRAQKLKYIFFPKFLPFFKSGILSSFGMIWKVVVAGEVLSLPKNALGTLLSTAQVHLESSQVSAIAIFIVVLSFLFELVLRKLNFLWLADFLSPICVRVSKIFKAGEQEKFEQGAQKKNSAQNEAESAGIFIKNLTLRAGDKEIIKNLSLEIPCDKVTALIAPSGFGKTTFLNYLSANFSGVSFGFQEPRLLENLSAEKNVSLPLENLFDAEEALRRADYFLDSLGLFEKRAMNVEKLSGGEKQRVAIARAFAFPSKILLLDESFNALDYKLKLRVMDFLRGELEKNPRTVVFVTHDERDAKYFCHNIIELGE